MTVAVTTPARRRKPPPDPLDGIPCCVGCGALLFEDLLGRLRCIRQRCARYREVVGQANVDVGVLTAEAIEREVAPAERPNRDPDVAYFGPNGERIRIWQIEQAANPAADT